MTAAHAAIRADEKMENSKTTTATRARAEPTAGSRKALGLLLVLVVQASVTISGVSMASLDNLTREKVVPDVIDARPEHGLKIEYSSQVEVSQGNELTPTQVKDEPKFTFDEALVKPDRLYLLAMVDPDAPSRKEPKLREMLHFMIANIPGRDLAKGDTFAEYVGSGPPAGTGLHRYIFLLYEQKERLKGDLMHISKTSRAGRANFSIRKFAQEHKLGAPVAANFYQAQFDDYVPKLHAQLSQG